MQSISQTIGLAVGWLLVGWVAVQATVVALKSAIGRARRKRRYAEERAAFCRRVEAAARAARASKAIADWSGWRPFRVAAIVDEAANVKSFYITPEDGRPLSPFAPGQYLTFRLPLPGGAPLVRCYSLSDRPRQDFYRATIKRIGPPLEQPGAAPGRGSNYFHASVHVGDVLDVRAPAGTFLIDPLADEPIVLIGAGIGVTPLVSMLEALVQTGRPREVHVLFGFRNGSEHPFKERVGRIAAENPHIRLHVSYSAPAKSDVKHRDYNDRGRLTLDRIREVLPSNNYRFYVCGPGTLMESLVPALWKWGVPESHVHFEAFGPASVRSASRAREKSRPCEVRFDRSGRAATWDGFLASLLEFGEAAGVKMPSGCRAGSCGECLMAIREGAITTVKQPGIPVPPGHCLTCISVPQGELVLDA
jgi:ferredoxin-NADP reductase/ferredoxin